jgi:hypothetical protein
METLRIDGDSRSRKLCLTRTPVNILRLRRTHMAGPPWYSNTGDDTGAGLDRESLTGTPRWVKVFGIIALVVVLLVVLLLLTRGPGGHGPNRHTSDGLRQPPISSVTARGP